MPGGEWDLGAGSPVCWASPLPPRVGLWGVHLETGGFARSQALLPAVQPAPFLAASRGESCRRLGILCPQAWPHQAPEGSRDRWGHPWSHSQGSGRPAPPPTPEGTTGPETFRGRPGSGAGAHRAASVSWPQDRGWPSVQCGAVGAGGVGGGSVRELVLGALRGGGSVPSVKGLQTPLSSTGLSRPASSVGLMPFAPHPCSEQPGSSCHTHGIFCLIPSS